MRKAKPHAINIHEKFLRHVWSSQYLVQSRLTTSDGRPVEILDVGKMNFDSGPDFLDATVKIGTKTFVGDVEIHRSSEAWMLHQHHNDPRYNKVVLHVVLEKNGEKELPRVNSGRKIPVLVLAPFLSESIRHVWRKTISQERERLREFIKCHEKNSNVEPVELHRWLDRLAIERLELKLRKFEERLKELARERSMALRETPRTWGEPPLEGFPEEIPPPLKELTQRDFAKKDIWEQLLYEGFMEGLGYSKNRKPFVKLAQSVTLQTVKKLHLDEGGTKLEALLFGVAGLIPKVKSLKNETSKQYARELIKAWQETRNSYRSETLHSADWQFFPTRPMNFPTIRIAAASAIIPKFFYGDVLRVIVQTVKSSDENSKKLEVLRNIFRVEAHPFWSGHYSFDEPASKPVNPLGTMRINDVIINTVLPVSLLYARIFRDCAVREGAASLFDAMPPLADNTFTRLMQKQLIKDRLQLNSASKQQAVIQLYKYYCSQGRCAECAIGKSVFHLPDTDAIEHRRTL